MAAVCLARSKRYIRVVELGVSVFSSEVTNNVVSASSEP